MKVAYINGLGSVSAQQSSETDFLENAIVNTTDTILAVQAPNYKDFIPPVALRRMAVGVKNSIVASALAQKDANSQTVDAIIVGTGTGCIQDSETFLKAILDNNEEYLTPTSFIQSIQNSVATQIALGIKCHAYNYTYVNSAASFESALFDASMMVQERSKSTVLVGGVDEMAEYTNKLLTLAGIIKSEAPQFPLLQSNTKGVVYGSGATFFVLEDKPSESTYAKLVDVEIINRINLNDLTDTLLRFLDHNSCSISDVDAVILGFNGDVDFDQYYHHVASTLFVNTPQIYYKHLCGEFSTSSAFGLSIGCKVLKNNTIPAIVSVNQQSKALYKTILLYNQYQGSNHSFVLISLP